MPATVKLYGQGQTGEGSFKPIIGVRNSLDRSTLKPDLVNRLINMYCRDPLIDGGVVGRPGFQTLGAQLGSGGNRVVQCIGQFTHSNGTETTFCWVGGTFYVLNWSTRTWTSEAHGLTVSATARIYFTVLNDKLIFSDGVNKPFVRHGVGSWQSITNAPVMYGQPVVYYAKLMGIEAANRVGIVWSEEMDPFTGYQSGIFDNQWDLVQTRADGLQALVSTNEALYYFRARSIGAIRGAVTPDFKNDGTREGVSEETGTTCQPYLYEQTIFFLDADGMPHKLLPGTPPIPLYADAQYDLTVDRTKLPQATLNVWRNGDMVLFGIPRTGTYADQFIVWSGPDDKYQGYWEFRDAANALSQACVIATVKNATLNPVLVHGTPNGYIHDHGEVDGSVWDDFTDNGAAQAIEHTFRSAPLGGSATVDKDFDVARLTLRLPTNIAANSNWYAKHLTSRGNSATILLPALTAPANDPKERQLPHAYVGQGRWCMLEYHHKAVGERFEILGVETTAYITSADPAIV